MTAADQNEIDSAARLAEARKAIADWKKIEKAEREFLLKSAEANGDDQALTASGAPVYHLVRSERTKVLGDKLHALWPDIYDQCIEITEIIQVKVD